MAGGSERHPQGRARAGRPSGTQSSNGRKPPPGQSDALPQLSGKNGTVGAGPAVRRQSSEDELLEYSRAEEDIQVINYVGGESGGAYQPDNIDGSKEDAPRREGQEAENPL